MLVNRLLALFPGYLAIRFRGERVERFINLCLQHDIPVWDIYTTRGGVVVGKTSIEGFRRMRPVARRSRVTVRILRRRGLPFLLQKLWQRSAFTCGALLFIVGLYFVGSIIWFVDVQGTETLSPARIVQAAAELGIRPGAFRSGLQSASLSRDLVVLVPEISWAGIELKGSRASIRVVEKKMVPIDSKPVGDVVASKSGAIQKIVTTAGQPNVRAGDTVKAGQVLISGTIQVDDNAEKRYVHAEGIVTARVWYEGVATSAQRRLTRRPTGKSVTREVLTIGDHTVLLRGPDIVPFEFYEAESQSLPLIWRNLGLAVEHTVETYREMVEEYEQVGFSAAKEEALAIAAELARAQLPADVRVEDQLVQAELLSDQNTVSVRVVIETIEAIGDFVGYDEPPVQGGN